MEEEYKIMFDYGNYEGYKLQDMSFKTVDQAVKHAVAMNYSTTFIIVKIYWKPEIINNPLIEESAS